MSACCSRTIQVINQTIDPASLTPENCVEIFQCIIDHGTEAQFTEFLNAVDWRTLSAEHCDEILSCIINSNNQTLLTQLLQILDFTQLTEAQCQAIADCCEQMPVARTLINLNGATAGVDVLQDTGNVVNPLQQVLTEAEFDAFLAGANLVSTGTQLTVDPPNVSGPADASQISFWVTVPDGETRALSWSLVAASGAVDLDRCGCGEVERIGFFSHTPNTPAATLSATVPGGVHLVTVSMLDHNGGNIGFDYTGDPIDFYTPSTGTPTVEIVELFFQCDGTWQDADGNLVEGSGTPGLGGCGTGEPIKASQIIDPQNLMTSADGQITVNAGGTAAVGDDSNGTADVALGETIHFHSSDDSVDAGVTEGSAIVDLRAHKTVAVGCAVRELTLAFVGEFVDGLHRVPMPGGNGFATIDITNAPNLTQSIASNFLQSNAADTHPIVIRFDTPVVNPVLRLNDIDTGPETVRDFTVNGVPQTPIVAGAGTQGNPNGPWSSNQNGVTQSFTFTGEVTEITFDYTATGGGIAVLVLSVLAGFSVPTYTCQSPDGVEEVLFRDDDTAVPAADVVPCPVTADQLPDGIDTFGTVGSAEFTPVTTTNGVTVPVGESFVVFPDGTTWAAPAGATDTSGTVATAAAALTTTNGVAVPVGGEYITFPDGTTWAAPAGGSVNPLDLISTEEGNTLRAGDDGRLYADPSAGEQCYIERGAAVAADAASFYDNIPDPFTVEGTSAHQAWVNTQFQVDLSGFTAPLEADEVNNDWYLRTVRLARPGAPFNASNNFNLALIRDGVVLGTSTGGSLAGTGPTTFTFATALNLKPQPGDVFQFVGAGNQQGGIGWIIDTDGLWTLPGDDNSLANPGNGFGPFLVNAGPDLALPMSFSFEQVPLTEHRVTTYDDGEGPKLVEFDDNGDPQEVASIPATWTSCGGLQAAGLTEQDIRDAQNDYVLAETSCFVELIDAPLPDSEFSFDERNLVGETNPTGFPGGGNAFQKSNEIVFDLAGLPFGARIKGMTAAFGRYGNNTASAQFTYKGSQLQFTVADIVGGGNNLTDWPEQVQEFPASVLIEDGEVMTTNIMANNKMDERDGPAYPFIASATDGFLNATAVDGTSGTPLVNLNAAFLFELSQTQTHTVERLVDQTGNGPDFYRLDGGEPSETNPTDPTWVACDPLQAAGISEQDIVDIIDETPISASNVTIIDTGDNYESTNVEDALAEIAERPHPYSCLVSVLDPVGGGTATVADQITKTDAEGTVTVLPNPAGNTHVGFASQDPLTFEIEIALAAGQLLDGFQFVSGLGGNPTEGIDSVASASVTGLQGTFIGAPDIATANRGFTPWDYDGIGYLAEVAETVTVTLVMTQAIQGTNPNGRELGTIRALLVAGQEASCELSTFDPNTNVHTACGDPFTGRIVGRCSLADTAAEEPTVPGLDSAGFHNRNLNPTGGNFTAQVIDGGTPGESIGLSGWFPDVSGAVALNNPANSPTGGDSVQLPEGRYTLTWEVELEALADAGSPFSPLVQPVVGVLGSVGSAGGPQAPDMAVGDIRKSSGSTVFTVPAGGESLNWNVQAGGIGDQVRINRFNASVVRIA